MARPSLPDRLPWLEREPGQFMGRGHPAGDFLEAYDWKLLEESPGRLRVDVHVADAVRNPLGQVFGGFTPTYIDLIALYTMRSILTEEERERREVYATSTMHVDYLEPLVGPRFRVESEVAKRRNRSVWVHMRFLQEDELAVFAAVAMRAVPNGPRS